MKVNEWLGNDNELGQDIWHKKYQYKNETFDDWLDRVSGGDSNVRQLIKEKKFLFGGRILSNRGMEKLGKKVTLSNCYVITPPDDNIESIFECGTKLARTFSYGGGCGIDIGNLRPRNAKVNNSAEKSTGAVSFMDLYSDITGTISQNGRRGALMISIPCNHPDLEEFIDVKTDLNKVTKANISIRITGEFMKAVEKKEPFDLVFSTNGEKITKTVNAYDLFHKICKNNWDYAEPAMLFWDRIENWNMLSEYDNFNYAGVNPCFTGDMKLLTANGYKTFEELCDKKVNIINKDNNISEYNKVWCSGYKDIVELKFSNNKSIKCTPNHVFMLNDGSECMAKDLRGKRCMPHIKSNNIDYNERYVKYGFIQGDGQTQRLNSQHHQGMEVNIGKNDKDIMDLFSNENFKLNHSARSIYLKEFKDDMNKLGFSTNSLPTRDFPTEFNNFTYIEKISFLKGLFSANGCVVAHHRVQFKSTCYELILNLKDALDDLGIHSNITTNKPTEVKFENGTYLCKQSYDLAINRYDSIVKFYDLIGFVHNYKNEKLKNLIIEKSPVITSIQYLDKQKVYDFTENITHWGVVNGYIVHNCAEEPLPKGGSCLLGSINLSEFIKHKTHPYFDFNEFEKAVKIAVKGLNDVLDEGLLLHPLKEQQDSVHDWRQIGLGIMGLADMLIKVGMVYGSDESIELCETIGRVMINSAVQASSELANAKGSFVKYNCHDFMKSDFVKSNLTQQTLDKVRTCGLRNSQLLTAAPTGTISTMLGISGGIEPVFANYYTRKTESLHGKDKYYKIFTTIAWDYLQKHDLGEDETKLPKQFITSSEIPYINRIKMQAIWQHYIDASISSTVNLPNEATIEDIENLYLNAWKNGLKGITVYRAGCKREGILVTNDDKNDIDKNAPTQELERGTIIEADDNVVGLKRKLTTGCGSLHCTAFFDPISGDLMETYLSKGSSGGCHNFMVGLSRMMSLAARGGVDIQEICDQLDSCGVCPSYATRRATKGDTSKGACCPMAIGNALRDMYDEMQDRVGNYDYEYDEPIEEPNPTIIYKDESTAKCPECGEPMRHEGGCDVCSACGYSHCD